MASQGQKRDIADFFKPYSRSISQKRPSSSEDISTTIQRKKAKSPTPKTPVTVRRLKDAGTSPFKSPFGPRSGSSVSIPIRSPRRPDPATEATYSQRLLFKVPSKASGSTSGYPLPLSFTDVPNARQSVVKGGKVVAVKGSDEEDDTDSLESLEDIFGRKFDGENTSSSSPPELDEAQAEAERVRTLSMFTLGRSDPLVGKDKLRALVSREREHKFDISRLMGDHFDDQEIESNLARAKEGYEESARDLEMSNPGEDDDRNLLASIVNKNEGEDEFSRLMDAVERTEAFTTEKAFSFFGSKGLTDWTNEVPFVCDFPEGPGTEIICQNGDGNSRSRAFLSGFVAEAAAKGDVEDSVLNWTFEHVVIEQRDELRRAYAHCLQQASAHWTRTNITAKDVQIVFQTLGADDDAVRDGLDIEPKHQPLRAQRNSEPKCLLSILDLFKAIASDMDFTALSKLASLLTRLALDENVMSDGRVSSAVESTLSTLLEIPDLETRTHVAERVLSDIGQYLHEPTLQAQVLSHILPTSPLAAKLRIGLAQRFLLGQGRHSETKLESIAVSLPQLTHHLNSPAFDITGRSRHRAVDYAKLKATTMILDVAVADGGRPASFATRADEVAFNQQVDIMADRLKSIFASIADTGASHMRRTEAKEVMQALHYRLIFAVRTESRPKKNIFGAPDLAESQAEERSQGFMSNFLAQMKERKTAQLRDGNEVQLIR